MKEFALKLTGTDGELTVRYGPLSYKDWLFFSDPKTNQDKDALRYLFRKYILAATFDAKMSSGSIDPVDMVNLSLGLIDRLVATMISDSGFDNAQNFADTVKQLGDKSMSAIGVYDTFILIHGGIDIYRQYLDASLYERAHLVAVLEKTTRISVAERFKYATENSVDLDIVSSPEKFKSYEKTRHMEHQRVMKPPNKANDSDLPTNINAMIEDANKMLRQVTEESRKNPRSFFNVQEDERQYKDFDRQ